MERRGGHLGGKREGECELPREEEIQHWERENEFLKFVKGAFTKSRGIGREDGGTVRERRSADRLWSDKSGT